MLKSSWTQKSHEIVLMHAKDKRLQPVVEFHSEYSEYRVSISEA